MPGSSFRSSVKDPDKLFVFCTSQAFERDLAVKFGCDACVEISDTEKFALRLRGALRPNPRVKLNTLRHDPVKYYLTDNPPEAVWALPDEIIMQKREAFADEAEYRFARPAVAAHVRAATGAGFDGRQSQDRVQRSRPTSAPHRCGL